jgi:hypothetical protein
MITINIQEEVKLISELPSILTSIATQINNGKKRGYAPERIMFSLWSILAKMKLRTF